MQPVGYGKRYQEKKYDDMSATEQQILEDFDTHELRKHYDETCVKKAPSFRGTLIETVASSSSKATNASSSSRQHVGSRSEIIEQQGNQCIFEQADIL